MKELSFIKRGRRVAVIKTQEDFTIEEIRRYIYEYLNTNKLPHLKWFRTRPDTIRFEYGNFNELFELKDLDFDPDDE